MEERETFGLTGLLPCVFVSFQPLPARRGPTERTASSSIAHTRITDRRHEVHTLDQQCKRAYNQMQERPSPLAKYTFLSSLRDQNIVLFYSLCLRYLEEALPIVYTPTVSLYCCCLVCSVLITVGICRWEKRSKSTPPFGAAPTVSSSPSPTRTSCVR